jgi:hypothetical protein
MKNKNFTEAVLIFLIVASAYGYFYSQQDSNTHSRLALVKAIVEEKHFEIDSYHDSVLITKDTAYYNGHYYSDKAIGSSLIGVPVYYLMLKISNGLGYAIRIKDFKQLMTFVAISLISAFLAPILYLFVKQISTSARYALVITAAICLGTPLYLYSATYYSHALTGLLLFIVFYIWFRARSEGSIGLAKTSLSGFLLGYAFITEYPSALIAAALGLYILYIMWEQRKLADWKIYFSLIAGAFIPLSLMMIYNFSIFKSPFATGYLHESNDLLRAGIQTGVVGFGPPNLEALFFMTFHTTMGIFWQSPVLLLAFVGWIVMWRSPQYRPEAIFSFGASLLYFMILSGYYWWWGGLTFTPRFIIASLPLFGIPLAFLPQRARKVTFVLTLLSIAQMFIVTATAYDGLNTMLRDISTDRFFAMFENSTIYSIYLPNFLSQQLVNNRGNAFFDLHGYASLIPLFIIEAIFLTCFMFFTHPPKEET